MVVVMGAPTEQGHGQVDDWAMYNARRRRTIQLGHIACEGCGGEAVAYDIEENIGLCQACLDAEEPAETPPAVGP